MTDEQKLEAQRRKQQQKEEEEDSEVRSFRYAESESDA